MLRHIKAQVAFTAQALGYDIHRLGERHTGKLLSSLAIDLVIDVGANKGQFALACRRNGYSGEIVSFEPLRAAHDLLCTAAKHDPKWTIAERMAVGDEPGQVVIYLAGNSAASSVLPMLEACVVAEPQSRYVGQETVPLRRLDDVLEATTAGRRMFLKLDVQGFERNVLNGAPKILAVALAIQLEMSLVPLYEGETLMPEMQGLLRQQGFALWDLRPGFRDPSTGRLLQVDGIFVKQTGRSALAATAPAQTAAAHGNHA